MRVAAALLGLLVACARPPAEDRVHVPPDTELRGVELRRFRGSELTLVATAPVVTLYRNEGDLTAADAGLWLPAEASTVTVRALVGNVLEERAEGLGVVLLGREGLRGESPRATFHRHEGAAGVAASDAGVRLTHPAFTLDARAFRYDLAEERAGFDGATTTFSGVRPP